MRFYYSTNFKYLLLPPKAMKLPKQSRFIGPASIIKRFAAFIIDVLILNLVVLAPLQSLFAGIVPSGFRESYHYLTSNAHASNLVFGISIFVGLMFFIYFTVLEKVYGQSIGKMLMHISVVSETKQLTWWQVIVRNLFVLPFFPFILLWVIDPLMMAFSAENRRLSDILSKTKVVQSFLFSP